MVHCGPPDLHHGQDLAILEHIRSKVNDGCFCGDLWYDCYFPSVGDNGKRIFQSNNGIGLLGWLNIEQRSK